MRALREPAELIIYPDQRHNISTPSYKNDRLDRYVAWHDTYVKKMASVSAGSSDRELRALEIPLHEWQWASVLR